MAVAVKSSYLHHRSEVSNPRFEGKGERDENPYSWFLWPVTDFRGKRNRDCGNVAYKTEEEASAKLRKDGVRLAKYQDVLNAHDTHALPVILQATDTAGRASIRRTPGSSIPLKRHRWKTSITISSGGASRP
jgi:hypothetical protein